MFLAPVALNVSIEDNLGEWKVAKICTGRRYVEKNVGWWWRRKKVISSVTCNSTGDVHAPKKAIRWLSRECVNRDGCRGCPPSDWNGECPYTRSEECDLPPCEGMREDIGGKG